jgi:hypothetical protein
MQRTCLYLLHIIVSASLLTALQFPMLRWRVRVRNGGVS